MRNSAVVLKWTMSPPPNWSAGVLVTSRSFPLSIDNARQLTLDLGKFRLNEHNGGRASVLELEPESKELEMSPYFTDLLEDPNRAKGPRSDRRSKASPTQDED